MLELTLYTRQNCKLCHEMEALLASELAGREHHLQTIDVDSDPRLTAEFGWEVPVLFVNGRKAFKYRCAARDLRLLLAREGGR